MMMIIITYMSIDKGSAYKKLLGKQGMFEMKKISSTTILSSRWDTFVRKFDWLCQIFYTSVSMFLVK